MNIKCTGDSSEAITIYSSYSFLHHTLYGRCWTERREGSRESGEQGNKKKGKTMKSKGRKQKRIKKKNLKTGMEETEEAKNNNANRLLPHPHTQQSERQAERRR